MNSVGAARASNRKLVGRCLWLTILGGLLFLSMQAYEWSALIREGAWLSTNPWGVPLFSACLFLIIGFHGAHVLTGMVIVLVTARRSAAGRTRPEGVELTGL